MSIHTPDRIAPEAFTEARAAVDRLCQLYAASTAFLCDAFARALAGDLPQGRVRAFYPEIRLTTATYAKVDSRLSFGHVSNPGIYAATITRPDLFRAYLEQQIGLLLVNHGVGVAIGHSHTPIPVHFAVAADATLSVPQEGAAEFTLRDYFDVPDLATTNDDIVNGTWTSGLDGAAPLAPFTAQRIDYSLARLTHYTATNPCHFQNYVLFTNYQFYVSEFETYARRMLADRTSGYTAFVSTGNSEITGPDDPLPAPERLPQMPAYHLKRADGSGITLVNIGVGPSNAKTATDHIAVLRPHAWVMVGHCAGLRNSQSLGDFVLAHAYLREDHVLDADLPTGTVASVDNRNWELREQSGPVQRLSQSRAIALDMESATIAANGFRFRVPYGTLLCVSDKPLQGELKLPGMASDFYKSQVSRHLMIGIRAMESLRRMPLERIHSRKLRSFEETAFL